MKIHQNDLGDILNILPDEKDFTPEDGVDFVVCTLGFEERTYAVVDSFLKNHIYPKNILLINYPTNKKDNALNRPKFEQLKSFGVKLIEIEYEKTTFYNSFLLFFREHANENSKVIFDISTCSSYLFYPIIKALIDINIDLTITYTEANEYDPSQEEWDKVEQKAKSEDELFIKSWDEANFQSINVDDVYSSNLFSEMNPGNKPAILIAIPNFNSIRMQTIKEKDKELNKTDLENIVWLIGMPPREENKWRAEALLKTNALERIRDTNIWYISTLYYKETLKQLESLWVNNKYTAHISIGTLGSKMQHLATFFFIYLHPDVGLWLAEPKEFKANPYSKGVLHIYQICFGLTENLKNKLSKYMHFEYEF